MKRYILFIILFLSLPVTLAAQGSGDGARGHVRTEHRKVYEETHSKFDISTNLFDWADFGTVNLDFGVALSRHFSFQIGGKYNNWEFANTKGPVYLTKNQQMSGSLGFRYWPWYVFSGWWISAKAQYCDYSECGVWRQDLDEGTAVGGGLSTGYSWMLGKHFNLEFGVGFWGGRLLDQNVYHCPGDCYAAGDAYMSGPRTFLAVNDINISLHWLF